MFRLALCNHGAIDLEKKACSVIVHTSIKDVTRTAWDCLADDLHMTYGWLRAIEETFIGPVEYRYFLVLEKSALIGVAVCHIQYPTLDSFNLDDAIFGRLKRFAAKLGLSILPSLICGSLRGYGQHFLFGKDLTVGEQDAVAALLFDAIEQEAASLKLPVSFNNVMAQEPELVRMLQQRSYRRTINFPLNYLDIRWKNRDEYRTFLSRRRLNREVNKNRREGVTITQLDTISPSEDRLHQLINDNYMKYNGKPLQVRRDFFSLCKKYLGPEAIVYIAVKHGTIIGTTIMFHRKGIAYLIDVGVDHETAGNDFTYFNLTYYKPTADAIGMGIRRIYYGTMMYKMKSRRGCATKQMYLYHKPRLRLLQTAAIPLFFIHRHFKSWFINRCYFH